jgi:glycosyltransferase involved in cell wall biosynthesis
MSDILPLLSVLMTSYNREKYIEESIRSVLNQTFTDFELIIVDDASTDDTLSIARKYQAIDKRIKVYANDQNLGDYPNRNKAATYANCKYIKFVDSDDIVYPHALQVFVWCMESFPGSAIGIAENYPNYEISFPRIVPSKDLYKAYFSRGMYLNQGPTGLIFNREKFFEFGMFSGINYLGDTEFLLKICATNPAVHIPPFLYWWRTHEGQQIKEGNRLKYYKNNTGYIIEKALLSDVCPLPTAEVYSILIKRKINKYKSRLKSFFQ